MFDYVWIDRIGFVKVFFISLIELSVFGKGISKLIIGLEVNIMLIIRNVKGE